MFPATGATSKSYSILRNDRAGANITAAGAESTSLEITSFDALGYNTPGATPDTSGLLFKFGDPLRTAAVVVEDIPGTAGPVSHTNLGLRPKVGVIVSSRVQTENAVKDDTEADSWGVGLFDDDLTEQRAHATANIDGLTLSGGGSVAFSRFGAPIVGNEASVLNLHLPPDPPTQYNVSAWGEVTATGAQGITVDYQDDAIPPLAFVLEPGKFVLFGISRLAVPEQGVDEAEHLVEAAGVRMGRQVAEQVHVDEDQGGVVTQAIFLDPLMPTGDTAQGGSEAGDSARGGSVAGCDPQERT